MPVINKVWIFIEKYLIKTVHHPSNVYVKKYLHQQLKPIEKIKNGSAYITDSEINPTGRCFAMQIVTRVVVFIFFEFM